MDCNIYDNVKIVLNCTVSSQGIPNSFIDSNNLDIKWFFDNGTDRHELTAGRNGTIRQGGNGDPVLISSTLALQSGTIEGNIASPVAEGAYYCQVHVDQSTMKANSSQRFTVLDFDQYIQSSTSCLERNFVATETACAVHDNIIENPTDHSTMFTDMSSSAQELFTSEPLSSDGHQPTDPPSSSSPGQSGGGGGTTLQVWIYVLVAVAAVFAMIIIILAIMCVGLCLRRSQSTMDSANCKLPINLVHDTDTSK